MTLAALLADRAAKFGDRTFLVYERQAVAKVGLLMVQISGVGCRAAKASAQFSENSLVIHL